MKKKIRVGIILVLLVLISVCAGFCLYNDSKEEPYVVNTYDVTEEELVEEYFENNKPVFLVKHYEMSDGTWKTDNHTYQYRLEITGRMHMAVKDSTFVFLSNRKEITFDQAWKAAGLSSNMDDYFAEEDAKFVGWMN